MVENFPLIPPDLLEALERLYPDRCPDINLSDREVWIKAGSAQVVRFLRAQYALQQEEFPYVHEN